MSNALATAAAPNSAITVPAAIAATRCTPISTPASSTTWPAKPASTATPDCPASDVVAPVDRMPPEPEPTIENAPFACSFMLDTTSIAKSALDVTRTPDVPPKMDVDTQPASTIFCSEVTNALPAPCTDVKPLEVVEKSRPKFA